LYDFLFCILFTKLFFSSISEHILREARATTAAATQNDAAANSHTTKDDIIRLMHLFIEPAAQRPRTNVNGVLKRAELDARKSNGELSEAANPFDCLAEIFNDYDNF